MFARETRHGLHRVRSHGLEPARRLAVPGHGPGAPAAGRSLADRAGRRRHRADRRPERQEPGARRSCRSSRSRRNVAGIRRQLERFLDFEAVPNAARLVNNADWLRPITLLAFLRDVGKHFTVNDMLAKESVKRRLESDEGISFTEFSYLLLQALRLPRPARAHGCTLQMGGSDQWGNITAGIDLIRKMRGGQGARAGDAADEHRGRHEVRQNGSRAPCGSIRRGPRRSASISSGSTPTTATS